MVLLKNRTLILAKEEGTYGTDPTPAVGDDAIIAFDATITPEIDINERRDVGSTLSRLKELGGKRRCTVEFTTELRGSGTEGTAPQGMGALFQACGMSESIVGSTSATYAFQSSGWTGVTLYIYMDGLLHQVHGGVGTWELMLVSGETPKIKWSINGKYETPTDSAIATPTYNTTVPVVCKGLTATLDSESLIAESITLRANNTVSERPALTDATGIEGYQITDRNPDGELNPETVLLATKNWYTKYEADTVQALSVVIGSTAGNICTITASQCRKRQMQYADRDGVLTSVMPVQLARSGEDDELSIAFT